MQRAGTVIILMLISFAGGLLSSRTKSQDILFNVAYLLAILLLVSFVWTWINIRTIRLTRITRARRAQVGRTMEERFAITNTSVVPKLWLEMRDRSDLPDHRASHVVERLRGKGSYAWRVNTFCLQRGRYTLGPITLTCGDPFGLFQMKRELTPTSHVVVYPMTVPIARFALPVGILPGGDALRRRTHYITANAAGVRDYVPGDSFNRIHWRSTARRDRMIVKEFELDPLADIWLFPDLFRAVQLSLREPDDQKEGALHSSRLLPWTLPEEHRLAPSTEEYTVTIAASLAQHFLRLDRAVGLITYAQEREVIQADRGERQLNKILETLAVVRGEGTASIDHVLHAEVDRLPRGTTLIIITPATSEQLVLLARHLERRGVRVMMVLVDPGSFGAAFSAAGVVGLLRAGNTPTYVVRRDDSLEEVLSQRAGLQHYYAVA
jgi:uncharacterized protein (DUF58 family)